MIPSASGSRATCTSSGEPLLTTRAADSCDAPIFRPITTSFLPFLAFRPFVPAPSTGTAFASDGEGLSEKSFFQNGCDFCFGALAALGGFAPFGAFSGLSRFLPSDRSRFQNGVLASLGVLGSSGGLGSLGVLVSLDGRSAFGFRSFRARFSLGGFFGRSDFALRESETSFFQNGTFSSASSSTSGSGSDLGSADAGARGASSPSVSQE
jgi:hypothetical protein